MRKKLFILAAISLLLLAINGKKEAYEVGTDPLSVYKVAYEIGTQPVSFIGKLAFHVDPDPLNDKYLV